MLVEPLGLNKLNYISSKEEGVSGNIKIPKICNQTILLLVIVLTFSFINPLGPSFSNIKKIIKLMNSEEIILTHQRQTLDYLENNSTPNDYLLMWGNEVNLNFSGGRLAPGRYVHIIPLLSEGYVSDSSVAAFIEDIDQKKPIIIDTSRTNAIVPSIFCKDCRSSAISTIVEFINANYKVIDEVGDGTWLVLEYSGPNN